MFQDLRAFVKHLEDAGQVVRVDEPLSTVFEVPAAIGQISRQTGKTAMFTNVKGYDVKVVGGVLGTRQHLAMAFGIDGDVTQEYHRRRKNLLEPLVVDEGPVQEVVIDHNVDILKEMPVLTHHELDAGPYLTSAITTARDPETGLRAMGIHRVQIVGPDTVRIFAGSPPMSDCVAKAEARGEPLEIAIIIGVDPLTFLASVTRAQGTDKYAIAGGLMGQPIELVKCRSVSLEVPARAEFVLEGHFIPKLREQEGPFGESTGYYLTYDNPVAQITTITRRRDAIYQALMPFAGDEETVLLGVTWEGEILRAMQATLPQVKKVVLRHINLVAFVQIDKQSETDAAAVSEQLLAVNPYAKLIVVVDEDVDPYDLRDVEWAIATRCEPSKDITVRADGLALPIDPSRREGDRSGKLFIDATKPLGASADFKKIAVPAEAVAVARKAVAAALAGR